MAQGEEEEGVDGESSVQVVGRMVLVRQHK